MATSPTNALTLAQVAARAGVSPGTVRRWVKERLMLVLAMQLDEPH